MVVVESQKKEARQAEPCRDCFFPGRAAKLFATWNTARSAQAFLATHFAPDCETSCCLRCNEMILLGRSSLG